MSVISDSTENVNIRQLIKLFGWSDFFQKIHVFRGGQNQHIKRRVQINVNILRG